MARKRPGLIPIFDSVVGRVTGFPNSDGTWCAWHEAFSTDIEFTGRLQSLREAGGLEHIALLRILDVVLWMHGTRGAEGPERVGDSNGDWSVPVGAAQAAFHTAAARDGIQLELAKISWINRRGHFGLPQQAERIAGASLDAIFLALGGQTEVQAGKRNTALPGDFYHAPTGTFIETDELQHFTTFRLQSLHLYPFDVPLGFDKNQYAGLADNWRPGPTNIERQRMRRALGLAGGRDNVRTTTHCAT
jgi:hypothetical protein